MAAPRKLDEALKNQILALVRAGNAPLTAARACGVAKSTWYAWLHDGREGNDPEYASLAFELETAVAAAKATLVAAVRSAAPRDWRAAMALLERRWPEEFGRKDEHLLVHAVPAVPVLSPRQVRRLEKLAGRVRGEVNLHGPDAGCSENPDE